MTNFTYTLLQWLGVLPRQTNLPVARLVSEPEPPNFICEEDIVLALEAAPEEVEEYSGDFSLADTPQPPDELAPTFSSGSEHWLKTWDDPTSDSDKPWKWIPAEIGLRDETAAGANRSQEELGTLNLGGVWSDSDVPPDRVIPMG